MKLLVTGGCGFTGHAVIRYLAERHAGLEVTVLDSLRRRGAEQNVVSLEMLGATVMHGDVRVASDFEGLDPVDWVIDCAAEPSVLAGTPAQRMTSKRQLVEHNLLGTLNILEFAARNSAGVVLLSTSRVYSIAALSSIPLSTLDDAFAPVAEPDNPQGLTNFGIGEAFSTDPPLSLYGATKIASEALAWEYAADARIPIFVNRCGVLTGGGQFGRADQGIFAWWIRQWANRQPLNYIGFGGHGHQVRDCLHPRDLAALIDIQLHSPRVATLEPFNVSGGPASARSLAQLSRWCRSEIGDHAVGAIADQRPNDVPWLVLDHRKAVTHFSWQPEITPEQIFLEILAEHRASGSRRVG